MILISIWVMEEKNLPRFIAHGALKGGLEIFYAFQV